MRHYLPPALKLTIAMIVFCCIAYFGIVYMIGLLAPGNGSGVKVYANGRVVGYERIGQHFSVDKYFWGRPSAVGYNAAGSAGSNKGPSNAEYLALVKSRIDTFKAHNPGVSNQQIPVELVTASGSGLDPHISPAAAMVQVRRVAATRRLDQSTVKSLVEAHTEKGTISPDIINVLKLNIALDQLK